jgi:hypothetical protein
VNDNNILLSRLRAYMHKTPESVVNGSIQTVLEYKAAIAKAAAVLRNRRSTPESIVEATRRLESIWSQR